MDHLVQNNDKVGQGVSVNNIKVLDYADDASMLKDHIEAGRNDDTVLHHLR